MKRFGIEKFFHLLVCSLFFLPLIFSVGFWNPFESPKVFFFLFAVELALPFYLFLIAKYPERRPSLKDPFLLTLLAFLFLETVTSILGIDPWNSFFGNAARMDGLIVWYHLFFFFLYLQYSLRSNPKHRQTFIRLFLLTASFSAFLGCLQLIGIIPYFSNEFDKRVTSTLGNPIFLASVLLIPLFLAITAQQEEKKTSWKYLYRAIALVCLLALFATQTRGAFVGLFAGAIVALGYWFWNAKKTFNKRRFLFSILLIITLLGGLFYTVRSFSPEGSSTYRFTHFSGANTDSRLAYWRYALKGWKDSPLLGVGHQNFYYVANTYFEANTYAIDKAWPDKPHNALLEVLVTGGFFTFLAYVLLFFFACRILLAHKKTSVLWKSVFLGGLTAYVVQNLFAFDTITSLENLFVLFALMTVHESTSANEKTKSVRSVIWITALIPLVLWVFLVPVIQEMHWTDAANTESLTNRATALTTLEKTKTLFYAFDNALIAKGYEDILNAELAFKKTNSSVSEQAFADTTQEYKNVIALHPHRAEYYYLSSIAYYLNASGSKTSVAPEAIPLAEKAHTLAPARVEPIIALANIYDTNGDETKAMEYAKNALEIAPTEPKTLWTLALFYARKKDYASAAPLAIQSIQHGLVLINADSLGWLINYEASIHDTKTLVYLYEFAVNTEPTKIELLPKLAAAYAANGQKEKAIQTANTLLQKAPESKPDVDAFIQSLH